MTHARLRESQPIWMSPIQNPLFSTDPIRKTSLRCIPRPGKSRTTAALVCILPASEDARRFPATRQAKIGDRPYCGYCHFRIFSLLRIIHCTGNRILFLKGSFFEAANFSLLYSSYWHPVYVAKFSQGTIADAAFNKRTAIATAGHFELRALKWYQLAMTWDHDSGIYALYANGIKIGHSDTTLTEHPHHDLPAPWLYFGNPAYAMGDISFYSEPLTESQISETFAKEAVSIDRDLQTRLEKSYQGRNLPTFDWRPSASSNWKCEQSLSLDRAEDYAHFFQQGCGPCLHFTNEGFRITTPPAHRILSPEGQDNYR